MSQCVSCANQPSDNDSLGGAAHEGTVTPMVIGIIIGTIAVFVLVVCALFYCVKLENNRYMAKLGPDGASCGGSPDEDPSSRPAKSTTAAATSTSAGPRGDECGLEEQSVESRPSSVTIVPSRETGGCAPAMMGVSMGIVEGGTGGKKRLFGWKRKSGEFVSLCDVA